MDRESHGTDGQNPTGYSPWGHRESDAIEHAHTKASGMGGWALLPWGGKGVRNSSHLSPSVLLQQGEALGADPTHRMTPDSDRCGFGILGTEVNSCVTYSMRLSAIFFFLLFFHTFHCFYSMVLLLFYTCNGNGILETQNPCSLALQMLAAEGVARQGWVPPRPVGGRDANHHSSQEWPCHALGPCSFKYSQPSPHQCQPRAC